MWIATGVPAQPGGHQASVVAILSMLFLMGALAFAPLVYALLLRRRAQRALRRCPMCGADGVRTATSDIRGLEADVRLQCGECDTWRFVTVPREELERHARRIERDRRQIGTCAQRLETERARTDIEAFAISLRSGIAGADDFTARTRATRHESADPPR